jgi:hypothetical protein
MVYHVVTLSDGNQMVVKDCEIKDGKISLEYFDNDSDSFYSELVSAEISKSYFVEISARFIMNPKDNSPMYRSMGMGNINHLAYTYSIIIVEYIDSYTLYEDKPFYSKSGIATTIFDMYSYHIINGTEKEYPSDRLRYEVECRLDLDKILLPNVEADYWDGDESDNFLQ